MNPADLPVSIAQNDLLRLFNWHRLDAPATESRCDFVAAGSSVIVRSGSGYLTTAPGAGVGLALYDKIAGVGGIAHFLLAKPQQTIEEAQAGYYVAAALPDFIEALVSAGADRTRLVAAVAGGSVLAGDLSRDSEISLGTQAVEATVALLQQHRIAVAAMEVGGLQPLSLLLDSRHWHASIKLIDGADRKGAPPVINTPSATEIEQAIDEAKPIPQIALKIIRLLGAESSFSFRDLAEEIKRDQVVASKVLRYSNSPLCSGSRSIDSIERATLLLGENNLLEIAVSTAADMLYSGNEGGYSLMCGGLYRHALAAAHTAREIAAFTGQVDPGIAYTAGLVHDIGKVVLDRFVADSLPFFYRHHDAVNDIVDRERELFGIDHMEIGRKLASKWQLPASLSQAISFHHRPESATQENSALVHTVHLADLLASVYLSGVEMEQINVGRLSQRMAVIGLQPDQLPGIIELIPWKKLMYM